MARSLRRTGNSRHVLRELQSDGDPGKYVATDIDDLGVDFPTFAPVTNDDLRLTNLLLDTNKLAPPRPSTPPPSISRPSPSSTFSSHHSASVTGDGLHLALDLSNHLPLDTDEVTFPVHVHPAVFHLRSYLTLAPFGRTPTPPQRANRPKLCRCPRSPFSLPRGARRI
ncbi:hypothetical protein K438DRAFT_1994202 [Mycena galopus ATCC 62051]|nr:hypothetical protein K438DRAFT_1994202 [Mycena galopus ATCC 62051]